MPKLNPIIWPVTLMGCVLAAGIFLPHFEGINKSVYEFLKPYAVIPVWVSFFSAITWLGDDKVLVLFFLPLPFLCFKKGFRKEGWFYVGALVFCRLLVRSLKLFFSHPRPEPYLAAIGIPTSFSYPSGHAFGSFLLFGVLARVLVLFYPSLPRRGVALFFTVLAVMVGFSRVALGVHWFADVAGGFLLALSLLAFHDQLVLRCSFFRKKSDQKI